MFEIKIVKRMKMRASHSHEYTFHNAESISNPEVEVVNKTDSMSAMMDVK